MKEERRRGKGGKWKGGGGGWNKENKKRERQKRERRVRELYESRGSHPKLSAPNSLYSMVSVDVKRH